MNLLKRLICLDQNRLRQTKIFVTILILILVKNLDAQTFTRITTGAIVNDSGGSIGASWGDYDNDGDIDLIVANDDVNNFLYRNNGDGTFTKITTGEIVNTVTPAEGCNWADFDNDGDLDIFIANRIDEPPTGVSNLLYSNNGNGTFSRVIAGVIVEDKEQSRGGSWADYDNDGDMDLFVFNVLGNNTLYVNNGNDNNWINIKCNGTASNVSAIGAKDGNCNTDCWH